MTICINNTYGTVWLDLPNLKRTTMRVHIPYMGFWSILICDKTGATRQTVLTNTWLDQAHLDLDIDISTLQHDDFYMLIIKEETSSAYWVDKLIA